MKRILVTGARGMLGTDVCAAAEAAGLEVVPTAQTGSAILLDVTDAERAQAIVAETRSDAVIHCAAYTNVDRAEEVSDLAFDVNALGSRSMALACARQGIPLCAISTDFVFDGRKEEPYVETDRVDPLSEYGRTKFAGECAVRQLCSQHWIVRTSWLFGLHGKCFPDTILRAAESRPELTVVADQRGTPTYTVDLASAIVRLIQYPAYGTYHVANSAEGGSTTWYEFARAAIEMAGLATPVRPIATADWPTPARRPANSALCCHKLETLGLPLLRDWREALHDYIDKRKALTKP